MIAEEALVHALDPSAGDQISVTGQIRSYNQRSDGVRHLIIFVFAASLTVEDGEPINDVTLEGLICKVPTFRRTPLGREICDVMLAVTRLLYHMSRVFQDNSLPESRPGGIQIDRKRLRKLREKKIAMGHKPDDHEEQWPQMTM